MRITRWMIWMRRLRVILNKFFIKYLVGCLGSDKYQDMYYCEASYNCCRMFKKSLEFSKPHLLLFSDDPYNFPARKEGECRNPQVKW